MNPPIANPAQIAALMALCSLGNVAAAVAVVSQTRTIEASASASVVGDSNSDSDNAAAAGTGVFNQDVAPTVAAVNLPDIAIAQGYAKQHSVLTPNVLSAAGLASVSLTVFQGVGSSAGAAGDSFFDVFFSIDEPSHYAFSGAVDTQVIVTGGASLPILDNSVMLTDEDNNTVIFAAASNDEAFAINGLLNPGNYRLTAHALIDASQFSILDAPRSVTGISEYELRLFVTGIPEAGTWVSVFGLFGMAAFAGYRARNRRAVGC